MGVLHSYQYTKMLPYKECDAACHLKGRFGSKKYKLYNFKKISILLMSQDKNVNFHLFRHFKNSY